MHGWSGGIGGRKSKGQGRRSRNKVNRLHHHVLYVGDLGFFLHVPREGHLAQCYCFLCILYNFANATGGEEGYKLLHIFFVTIPNRTYRSALRSVPALLVVRSHVCD